MCRSYPVQKPPPSLRPQISPSRIREDRRAVAAAIVTGDMASIDDQKVDFPLKRLQLPLSHALVRKVGRVIDIGEKIRLLRFPAEQGPGPLA